MRGATALNLARGAAMQRFHAAAAHATPNGLLNGVQRLGNGNMQRRGSPFDDDAGQAGQDNLHSAFLIDSALGPLASLARTVTLSIDLTWHRSDDPGPTFSTLQSPRIRSRRMPRPSPPAIAGSDASGRRTFRLENRSTTI